MTPDSIGALSTMLNINPWIFTLLLIWSVVWKGLALWKSATLHQKWWFVILLVVNTMGILEIIYYFLISRKYKVETITDEKN